MYVSISLIEIVCINIRRVSISFKDPYRSDSKIEKDKDKQFVERRA